MQRRYLPFADIAVKHLGCNMQIFSLHNAEMERHERLKRARERRFRTAHEAAEYLRIPYKTLAHHEAGTRGFKTPRALKYASVYRVNLAWLDLGIGPEFPGQQSDRTIQVVGYVGAGEEVYPIDDSAMGGGIEEPVDAALDIEDDAVAVRVRGTSMFPAYWDGDVLIYSRNFNFDREQCLYNECIVKVADGPTYVKRIMPGASEGMFTLLSYNAPDLFDVIIEWAAPVKIHDKRKRRSKPSIAA